VHDRFADIAVEDGYERQDLVLARGNVEQPRSRASPRWRA
jgi:hypothetical protein